MNKFIPDVQTFMKAAGQTEGEFNVRQTALYIGLQLEEMAEKLEAVGFDKDLRPVNDLHRFSKQFKSGCHDWGIENLADRQALLDADVDLLWVTIGAALSAGFDLHGAMAEVSRSNMSKMADGLMLKDANGKVTKGPDYSPPNLEPFVCQK